jgi:hypothetical protein
VEGSAGGVDGEGRGGSFVTLSLSAAVNRVCTFEAKCVRLSASDEMSPDSDLVAAFSRSSARCK